MYPGHWLELPELAGVGEIITPGRSAIVDPMGEIIAGPLEEREGILTAEIDLGQIPRAKFDFDVTGHYARPDVFRLEIDCRPRAAVRWLADGPQGEVGVGRGGASSFPDEPEAATDSGEEVAFDV